MITISEKEFIRFVEYIKMNYGIDLHEKKTLLETRLQNILQEKSYGSFAEYYNHIMGDQTGSAIISLLNKVTTNYTFFLREKEHFEFLKNIVLPKFVKELNEKDLRIWSAGCSSGEEPYTLAMILNDFFGEKKIFWDTGILATDISRQALETAKCGIYPVEQLSEVPTNWRMNYFTKYENDSYIISDKIKNDIIFRTFNLMNETFPFKKKFHIIFCRNVMIYFDAETKSRLINKFYEMTEKGGYLFIGHSETIDQTKSKYEYVMPAVYRKA